MCVTPKGFCILSLIMWEDSSSNCVFIFIDCGVTDWQQVRRIYNIILRWIHKVRRIKAKLKTSAIKPAETVGLCLRHFKRDKM